MHFSIEPLGEEAIIITFSQQDEVKLYDKVRYYALKIQKQPFPGFVEIVTRYHTITVHFTSVKLESVYSYLSDLFSKPPQLDEVDNRTLVIPVCYDEGVGLDLQEMSDTLQLSKIEIIKLHSEPLYTVEFIGFLPGFPFLSGMNPKLSTPRKDEPRVQIKKGSVGIAGNQTGIYSLNSPGGWNIIGKTPVRLFHVENRSPSFFQSGDRVKLTPISMEEYREWKVDQWEFDY